MGTVWAGMICARISVAMKAEVLAKGALVKFVIPLASLISRLVLSFRFLIFGFFVSVSGIERRWWLAELF